MTCDELMKASTFPVARNDAVVLPGRKDLLAADHYSFHTPYRTIRKQKWQRGTADGKTKESTSK
jgi:hypothetical protein